MVAPAPLANTAASSKVLLGTHEPTRHLEGRMTKSVIAIADRVANLVYVVAFLLCLLYVLEYLGILGICLSEVGPSAAMFGCDPSGDWVENLMTSPHPQTSQTSVLARSMRPYVVHPGAGLAARLRGSEPSTRSPVPSPRDASPP